MALLAEAGSGKTRGLRRLAATSADRFFIRVEARCTGAVAAALDTAKQDRFVRLDTEPLRALASHLMTSFPPEDDGRRDVVRRRDDQRVREDVRNAIMNLLGERHDVDGRAALERFVKEHVAGRDAR